MVKKRVVSDHRSKAAGESSLYSVMLVLIALGLLLLGGILIKQRYRPGTGSEITRYPLRVWALGDIIDDKKLAFAATAVSKDDKGMVGFWEAPAGKEFVSVTMSFKNKTGKVYHLSPVLNMKLLDGDNNEYEVSSAPAISRGLGGPVANGQTSAGDVGFLVPKSATKLKLVFDPHVVNENTIAVSL